MKTDKKIIAEPGKDIQLNDFNPGYTGLYKDKHEANDKLDKDIEKLQDLQDRLYAAQSNSVLIIFQAMDAAGKDSTIKHVMSGVNPQGCQVYSFKQPSTEELAHDYLWRTTKRLPEKGHIGIFNRSYYEEVIITRVHPQILAKQHLPGINHTDDIGHHFWKERYKQINDFEEFLTKNGVCIIKFFLNVSKEEQTNRLLERIENPEKNWKITLSDIEERQYWEDYQNAYEQCIAATSTDAAPWYIVPADKKWFMRTVVGDIIVNHIEAINPQYPKVSEKQLEELAKAKHVLTKQK
jgi:PPK2 family polyphosphate:nucleotide phosphotransferase